MNVSWWRTPDSYVAPMIRRDGQSNEYLELVPHERIRWTDRFDDPNLPGEMKVTVSLKKVSVGTEVNIVQEELPDVIPPEACSLGWSERAANRDRRVADPYGRSQI